VLKKGRILIDQWWKLWKLRNKERHGVDEDFLSRTMSITVRSKLEALYAKRRHVMQVDIDIFPHKTADEHFQCGQSLTELHDWCLDNGPAILASCSQASKLGVTGTGNIQSYFHRQQTHTDSATSMNASSSSRSS
jgi:hypothetical protein